MAVSSYQVLMEDAEGEFVKVGEAYPNWWYADHHLLALGFTKQLHTWDMFSAPIYRNDAIDKIAVIEHTVA